MDKQEEKKKRRVVNQHTVLSNRHMQDVIVLLHTPIDPVMMMMQDIIINKHNMETTLSCPGLIFLIIPRR